MDFNIGEMYCPQCGKLINGAISIDSSVAKPRSGDFSICVFCAQMLRFDDNLKLIELTQNEFNKLDNETKQTVESAIKFIKANSPN